MSRQQYFSTPVCISTIGELVKMQVLMAYLLDSDPVDLRKDERIFVFNKQPSNYDIFVMARCKKVIYRLPF